MKSSYKKAMIALGLMAAVLLLYKYSKVIDGFESGDTFVSISKTYINDAKKTTINDNKNMINLIKEYKTEDKDLQQMFDKLIASENNILDNYDQNNQTDLTDLTNKIKILKEKNYNLNDKSISAIIGSANFFETKIKCINAVKGYI